jgi:hypothetical protein
MLNAKSNILHTSAPAIEAHEVMTSPMRPRESRPTLPYTLKSTASQLSTCVRRNATFCCASSRVTDDVDAKDSSSAFAIVALESIIILRAFRIDVRRSGTPYRSCDSSWENSGPKD